MLKSEVTAAYGDKIYKIQIFVVCRHDGCKTKKERFLSGCSLFVYSRETEKRTLPISKKQKSLQLKTTDFLSGRQDSNLRPPGPKRQDEDANEKITHNSIHHCTKNKKACS